VRKTIYIDNENGLNEFIEFAIE